MIYDVDYFINKFEAIPENMWLIGAQGYNRIEHCALGHCKSNDGYYGNSYPSNSIEAKTLEYLFFNAGIYSCLMTKSNRNGWNIADVNNGDNPNYQQPTPKQRILAALYDIKKLQTKDIDTGAKRERIVYVAVPETIKEQASELIMQ